MEKKKKDGLKTKQISREYLHSIGRISDRLKLLKRDIKKLREELTDTEDDIQMLSDAFDSLFTDLIKELNSDKDHYDTENI